MAWKSLEDFEEGAPAEPGPECYGNGEGTTEDFSLLKSTAPRVLLLPGHVLTKLRELPDESVQCVVTSPPYWQLRAYGTDPQVWNGQEEWRGELGLEPTPSLYIEHLIQIFREVRRVLRRDGTFWLNLGDSYAGSMRGYNEDGTNAASSEKQLSNPGSFVPPPDWERTGLKPKDLVGIPWRTALALQADGWWLRSDIIWFKPNPMPESVRDRPARAHEYVFMLTRSKDYFYDSYAIKEPSRNRQSVWEIPTQSYGGAHFATFPEELPSTCILAGTSMRGACSACRAPFKRVMRETGSESVTAPNPEHKRANAPRQETSPSSVFRTGTIMRYETVGWAPTCGHPTGLAEPVPCVVLDPFAGSGTTLALARKLGRSAIGIELNPEYVKLAKSRAKLDVPPLDDFGDASS